MNLKQIFTRIREQHRLLFNLALIGVVILALAFASHFAMQIATRHSARCTVPDFSGIHINEALKQARVKDLKIQINDSLFVPAYEGGVVLDQLPQGGVEVKPGRTIYVTINSFQEKMVPVPYVAGYSLRQAKNMLEIAGLEIDRLIYEPDLATNYVLSEYCKNRPIKDGSRVMTEFGTGITLHVGVQAGDNFTMTPMLVGMSLKAAKGHLWEAGLNVGEVKFDEGINLLNEKNARVYVQTPAPRRGITLGSKVSIRLTLDQEKLKKNHAEALQAAKEIEKEELRKEMLRRDSLNILMGDSLNEVHIDSLHLNTTLPDVLAEDPEELIED